jgi:hypothetical protein
LNSENKDIGNEITKTPSNLKEETKPKLNTRSVKYNLGIFPHKNAENKSKIATTNNESETNNITNLSLKNNLNSTNYLNRTKTRKIVYSNSKTDSDLPFNKLTPKEKFRRIYLKITIVLLFNYIWNRMKFYGLNVLRADIEEEIQNFEKSKIMIVQEVKEDKYSWLPSNLYIHPENNFFNFWNVVRIILHLYSVTYMVYLICVLDRLEVGTVGWYFDYFIELLFFADMIIISLTAYHRRGEIISNNKKIIVNYLTKMFIIDFIGVFPFEVFYKDYNKPSMYLSSNMSFHRIIRILRFGRIYKLIMYYENASTIKRLIQLKSVDTILKKLRMNAGISRLINTLFIVMVLSHIFACIFFYSAKLALFNENTWINRAGLQDVAPNVQYLASLYYSLTVVTTVGFGDITSVTVFEKILTCLWMIIGVAFYSFVISNLSAIISSMDFHTTILDTKIGTLNDFAQKLSIPDYLYLRIKKVYEENDAQYFIQDENEILQDLPYNLKVETLFHIHHDKINSIVYFLDRSINLVVDIISKWKTISFDANEFVYLSGESPFDSKFIII